MASEQEEKERLRYLQLKAKASSNSSRQPDIIQGEEVIEDIPYLESAARGAGQALFGLGDEAMAAYKAVTEPQNDSGTTLGERFDSFLELERARNKASQKANPKTFAGSELATNLGMTFIPGIGMAKNAGLVKNALSAAAMSGLTGFGSSEGTLEERLKEGAQSAGIGGAIGTGSTLAVKGLQKLAPKIAEVATGATGKELENKFKEGSGKELLKRNTVGWLSTPKSIAEKATKELEKSSDDIGRSLKNIDPVSKDQIMANLFTERARLLGNEANDAAIKKLDKEISVFSKSEKFRSPQDIWDVKKSYESKVNWLAKKTKPNTTQANEKVATALRNAVTDTAETQSPELAKKFAEERQLYSLYKPIKEAAEREAATLQQRKIGGMLDSAAAAGGFGYGLYKGEDPLKSAGYGLLAAGGRRLVVPRLPSFFAKAADSSAVQQPLLRLPVSTYRGLIKKENQ